MFGGTIMEAPVNSSEGGPAGPTRSDQLYLEEVEAIPALSRAEAAELGEALKADESGSAAERLIRGHLHIVAKTARRFASKGVPLADLLEMGSIALRHAVRRYEPKRMKRFGTFAAWRVRMAMRRLVRIRLGKT
jgi:DNA-directed RNA polymerase sigma subunit (sigma70/sigma32)